MTEKVKPSHRRYDASGRQARARQTREQIIKAARQRFENDGYTRTKIVDVADAAKVSPETIYKAFGSKAELLRAAVAAAIRGDTDPAPLRRRLAVDTIRNESDARRQLEMYGDLLAKINPRLAGLLRVIRETETGDPEIAALHAQLDGDRLHGMSEFARQLADSGSLRPGISTQEARDVLWTLNSPELYELLVLHRRWTPSRYARWVAHTLIAALLD